MWVKTNDPARKRQWQRIFGTDMLPVLASVPRVQCITGRDVLAYDLALSKVTPGQRYRLAAFIARCQRRPYADVINELSTAVSWPIPAVDCYVEATELRPLPLFVWGRYGSINRSQSTYATKPRLISGLAG